MSREVIDEKMNIQNPHDKFFKETLGNVETAKDFLTHYLPKDLLEVMDVNTLEPQKDSFINEELEENFSDLLFKANICDKESYLYFMFEHKSYSDKEIFFQILKYMIEIWKAKRLKEKAEQLPIIIPIVMYRGKSDWKIPTRLSEQLDGYNELPKQVKQFVPNFKYILYDLSLYPDEEIKGSAQTRIMLTLLRDILTKTGIPLKESIYRALYYLNDLEDKESAVGYVETVMRYIFSVAKDLTSRDVEQMIHQLEINKIEGSDLAMTLAEMWREEGLEKGRKEGLEKGRELGKTEALAEVALLQLTNKLGKLPQDMKNAITQADVPTLQIVLTNIFSIQTIDDVRRYIK